MVCKLKHGSLPYYKSVKKAYWYENEVGHDHGTMVLITPDTQAGKRNRYSVFRINCQTGTIRCLGRELPMRDSQRIAYDAAPKWAKNSWFN